MKTMSCITQSLLIIPSTQISDVVLHQDGRKSVHLATTTKKTKTNKQTKRMEKHSKRPDSKEKHKIVGQHQSCWLPLCYDLTKLISRVVYDLNHNPSLLKLPSGEDYLKMAWRSFGALLLAKYRLLSWDTWRHDLGLGCPSQLCRSMGLVQELKKEETSNRSSLADVWSSSEESTPQIDHKIPPLFQKLARIFCQPPISRKTWERSPPTCKGKKFETGEIFSNSPIYKMKLQWRKWSDLLPHTRKGLRTPVTQSERLNLAEHSNCFQGWGVKRDADKVHTPWSLLFLAKPSWWQKESSWLKQNVWL